MGIIDKIKSFFVSRESTKNADKAIADVKKAAESQNYNQASIKAFYALETIGEVYAETTRDVHMTAREYASQLTEDGVVTDEELEPILVQFEVAKYSEAKVTFDDYSTVEKSLEAVAKKFKSGKVVSQETKSRRRRRKPKKGGRTGAARSGREGSRRRRRRE